MTEHTNGRELVEYLPSEEALEKLNAPLDLGRLNEFLPQDLLDRFEGFIKHPLFIESDRSVLSGETNIAVALQMMAIAGEFEELQAVRDQLIADIVDYLTPQMKKWVKPACKQVKRQGVTGRNKLFNPLKTATEFRYASSNLPGIPTYRNSLCVGFISTLEQEIAKRYLELAESLDESGTIFRLLLARTNTLFTQGMSKPIFMGGAKEYAETLQTVVRIKTYQGFESLVTGLMGGHNSKLSVTEEETRAEVARNIESIKDETLWKKLSTPYLKTPMGLKLQIMGDLEGPINPSSICYLSFSIRGEQVLFLEFSRVYGDFRVLGSIITLDDILGKNLSLMFQHFITSWMVGDLKQQPDLDLLKELEESMAVDSGVDEAMAQVEREIETAEAQIVEEEDKPDGDIEAGSSKAISEKSKKKKVKIDTSRFRNLSSSKALRIIKSIFGQRGPIRGSGSHRKWQRKSDEETDSYKRITLPDHGSKPVNQGLLIKFLKSHGILREFYLKLVN